MIGNLLGGTVGGGTMIIVLRTVFNFSLADVIPLSNLSILSGGIV